MTVFQRQRLTLLFLAILGMSVRAHADNDVTVIAPPTAAPAPAKAKGATVADGSTVVHKSLHRKKKPTRTVVAQTPATNPASVPGSTAPSSPTFTAATGAVHSVAATNAAPVMTQAKMVISPDPILPAASTPTTPRSLGAAPSVLPASSPTVSTTPTDTAAVIASTLTAGLPAPANPPAAAVPPPAAGLTPASPTVETALPISRYPGLVVPVQSGTPYTSTDTTTAASGRTLHSSLYASALPAVVSSAAGTFSLPSRTSTSDFMFANLKKITNRYPWKTGIITTIFWIGEGGSNISATANVESAWDDQWRTTNRGNDSPNDRNGYSPADHVGGVNPFYVALPFNDLAFPEKAREWVPGNWHKPSEDGKQVSACKDRWVWIKNAQGRSCFAQWEDVGPLRYDHAEYVFGSDRPNTYTRAGLDVSPAVAQYLGMDENKRAITSWRFVDDADVPPGQWLKYDEQAVIFTALHQLKSFRSSPTPLPIQRTAEPLDDSPSLDANKKKVDASRG